VTKPAEAETAARQSAAAVEYMTNGMSFFIVVLVSGLNCLALMISGRACLEQ
jgi:hypothetical protein